MSRRKVIVALMGAVLTLEAAERADASFHLMQIEQVIGGATGDPTAQAIQLRMRFAGEHFLSAARLRAWDAAGLNPVLLADPNTDLTGPSQVGDHILIATSSFAAATSPSAAPDYLMVNTIPASYLPAGSLTFEDDSGTIFWRLSWGGAGYTGSTAGNITNGTFSSPWPGPLPAADCFALKFTGSAGDASSSNSAQYALTTGASVWNNYAENSFTISKCVPTVSQWGMLVLILLVSSAGSVLAVRGRAIA
jgi:hypothetical protein